MSLYTTCTASVAVNISASWTSFGDVSVAQLIVSVSGVVLGGVAEVVGSNLARGKIFTASFGSVYIYHFFVLTKRGQSGTWLSSNFSFFTSNSEELPITHWTVLQWMSNCHHNYKRIILNPLSTTGPLLGHTYNYVECHGATFEPMVCGLILKLLYYNLKHYGRLYTDGL